MLEVHNLNVAFGRIQVLRDVNVHVAQGEVVAVIGVNGAGKTTLLRTLSGLVRAQSGSITYNDVAIGRAAPERIVQLGLAHVPSGRTVFGPLSVRENLELGTVAWPRQERTPETVEAQFRKVFRLFPVLQERQEQRADTLSGGQQQMLALGRALMTRPKLLLLDEPSHGLAPLIVRSIYDTLSLLRAEGLTLLLVEQHVRMALEFADRAYLLRHGEIVLQERCEVLRQTSNLADLYLGTSERYER